MTFDQFLQSIVDKEDAAAMQQLAHAYFRIAQDSKASIRLWQFVSSGTRRTAFLEEQWTLEKLQWKEIPQPPRSSEPATWQLIEKLEAAKNDPVPMLLRREVPEPQKVLANSLDGVFGLFLELKGDRVFNRFVRDEGVHRFHFANRKPDVHVFTGFPVRSR